MEKSKKWVSLHDMPTDSYQMICENGKWDLDILSSTHSLLTRLGWNGWLEE